MRCGPTTYYDMGTKVMQIPGNNCYLYHSPSGSTTFLYVGCDNQAGTACLIWQYYGLGTINTSQYSINSTLEKTCTAVAPQPSLELIIKPTYDKFINIITNIWTYFKNLFGF